MMRGILERVTLPSGIELPIVEQGGRDGVPVVLLHGITDSWRSYEPVLTGLSEAFRATTVTFRGHGDASKPNAGYAIADFGADVVALLDALDIPRAVIAGHSLGSVVAQQVAAMRPDRVAGLVLIGALFPEPDKPIFRTYWEEFFSTLVDPLDPAVVREFQESTLVQPAPPGFLDIVVAESLNAPAHVWRDAWHALVTMDLRAALPSVTAPALLIWGDQDTLALKEDQDALLASLPDSRLTVHAGAGHAVHWEEPERVAAEINEFIAEIA
jgi:pimeloyl-ACP methyl ester carboxylesterase